MGQCGARKFRLPRFGEFLAVEAAAQKSEADATVKFIAKGLRPFANPEQMAKMAGDLKTTADLAKARCTVEATSANGDK
jgi:hypothetical protein